MGKYIFFLLLVSGLSFAEQLCDAMILYPVHRLTQIPQGYAPQDLVDLGALGFCVRGEQQVRACVVSDLRNLFQSAQKDGIRLKITSAYRSYQKQVSVFDAWHQHEMNRGLSRMQAHERVQRYSAAPGHSEHQLGTVLDIISVHDTTFENTPTNKKVWEWLSKQCERYGFVISYPENKTEYTGYVHEPWHVRWVGRSIAQKLKRRGYRKRHTELTVAQYLQSRKS